MCEPRSITSTPRPPSRARLHDRFAPTLMHATTDSCGGGCSSSREPTSTVEPVGDAAHGPGARDRAPGARRPQCERFKRAGARTERGLELPSSSARPIPSMKRRCRSALPGWGGETGSVMGNLRGLDAPLRGLQGRERDRRGQPLPDPPHRADAESRRTIFFRCPAFQDRLEKALREREGWVAPRTRLQEARRSSAPACGRDAHAAKKLPGRARAWDEEKVLILWSTAC